VWTFYFQRMAPQHEDYFKKQMDQMGRVLGKLLADLLGLKSEGNILEANDIVLEVFTKDIGFDFDEIIQTKPEELVSLLVEKKKFVDAHIEDIANILFELGMEKKFPAEKEIYYSRANALFTFLNTTRSTFSFDLMLKMNRIKEELDEDQKNTGDKTN
jgi:hypothetical protein